MTASAKTHPSMDFFINNLSFFGFSNDDTKSLRTQLLGQALVLFFSVLMKGVLKLHHLFYGKAAEKKAAKAEKAKKLKKSKTEDEGDLEGQKEPNSKKLLEQKRKDKERKKLKEIYENYLLSSVLPEW